MCAQSVDSQTLRGSVWLHAVFVVILAPGRSEDHLMDDDISVTDQPVPGSAEEQTAPYGTPPVEPAPATNPAPSPAPAVTPWWSVPASTGAATRPAPTGSDAPRRTSN